MHCCHFYPCPFSPSHSCAGQLPVPDASRLCGTVQAGVCSSASSGPCSPRWRPAFQGQRDRCPAAGVQRSGGTTRQRQGTFNNRVLELLSLSSLTVTRQNKPSLCWTTSVLVIISLCEAVSKGCVTSRQDDGATKGCFQRPVFNCWSNDTSFKLKI